MSRALPPAEPAASSPAEGAVRGARGARVVHRGVTTGAQQAPLGTVAVVVPTYNTAATVPTVLRELVSVAGDAITEIMVIDNASTDGTVEAVQALCDVDPAVGARVRIARNPTNIGYGGSIKRGLRESSERFDLVAVIHSDDQCDAGTTLATLLGGLEAADGVDVVLASRFTEGSDVASYSLARRAGNRLFNLLTLLASGYRMSDAGTAIMVARGPVIAELPLERLTGGYRLHPQLNLLLYGDPRLVICEVPLFWHDASLGSRFSLTAYGMRLLRMLAVFAWRRRVRGWPLQEAVLSSEGRAE